MIADALEILRDKQQRRGWADVERVFHHERQ
jgi:hypothetical protein